MRNLGWKRLVLIGFIVILLISIPVVLYFLQQTQINRSRATKSTVLSFNPPSTVSAPITKNVGDSVPLDISVNPGTNAVNYVKIFIQYDPTKLSASSSAFAANSSVFPQVVDGPVYQPGKIAVSLSIGADPTKAITSTSVAGTVTFTALAPTDPNNPTSVTYTTDSVVTSVAGPPQSNDQFAENVLSTTQPAYIAIVGAATSTPTPTTPAAPTATPLPGLQTSTPTPVATATPTPLVIAQNPTTAPAIPTNTPAPVVSTSTPSAPTATLAPQGSTDVTLGIGTLLTIVTVVGAIIFIAL